MAYIPLLSPTPEDIEELLLIARYGELDELKSFVGKFGSKHLIDARDEDGNTILHMVCGNGHLGMTNSTRSVRVLFQCSFTDQISFRSLGLPRPGSRSAVLRDSAERVGRIDALTLGDAEQTTRRGEGACQTMRYVVLTLHRPTDTL